MFFLYSDSSSSSLSSAFTLIVLITINTIIATGVVVVVVVVVFNNTCNNNTIIINTDGLCKEKMKRKKEKEKRKSLYFIREHNTMHHITSHMDRLNNHNSINFSLKKRNTRLDYQKHQTYPLKSVMSHTNHHHY